MSSTVDAKMEFPYNLEYAKLGEKIVEHKVAAEDRKFLEEVAKLRVKWPSKKK